MKNIKKRSTTHLGSQFGDTNFIGKGTDGGKDRSETSEGLSPWIDDTAITDEDLEVKGELANDASKIVLKI